MEEVRRMKLLRKQPRGQVLRKGTAAHDQGLCTLMLAELTQDCSIQGRRRRSELAWDMSHGSLRHEVLVLVV